MRLKVKRPRLPPISSNIKYPNTSNREDEQTKFPSVTLQGLGLRDFSEPER